MTEAKPRQFCSLKKLGLRQNGAKELGEYVAGDIANAHLVGGMSGQNNPKITRLLARNINSNMVKYV